LTPAQLKRLAVKVYGDYSTHDLVPRLVADMKVDRSTVYRWLDGTSEVPGPVEQALIMMAENNRLRTKL
jgi:hypothetical protein